MKHFLLKTITLCALMIPLARSEAATPGGLKPGTTFKLTVTTRSSVAISQFKTDTHARVPSDFPDFKKGQVVKFTIGSNGQLKADRMSIPIVRANSLTNIYLKEHKTSSSTVGFAGILNRKKTIPEMVSLTFTKTSGKGFEIKGQTVSYVLE